MGNEILILSKFLEICFNFGHDSFWFYLVQCFLDEKTFVQRTFVHNSFGQQTFGQQAFHKHMF